MAGERINVLVYSGKGSAVGSVRHCIYSLRLLLSPNFAIIPVTAETIVKEPWFPSCALLVFPGGADLGYCESLNGEGNRRIKQYIDAGGSYLGFCAGGYYGSSSCEFEAGSGAMEVVGDRELKFFPGVCRGSAVSGFAYNSEVGARAMRLTVKKENFILKGSLPATFRSYVNGGSVFVDAVKFRSRGVEVLASYADPIEVTSGEGTAAVVYCSVGEGGAILTGPHPEFAAANLSPQANGMQSSVLEALTEDDQYREVFLSACLRKLGLQVNETVKAVPSLSRMHLSALKAPDAQVMLSNLPKNAKTIDGNLFLEGGHDIFRILTSSSGELDKKGRFDDKASKEQLNTTEEAKDLIMHVHGIPPLQETPFFDHSGFYSELERLYQVINDLEGRRPSFGSILIYGETVDSTNTLLEKNLGLTSLLPTGTTFAATTQLAGRGRGSNVWVSPPGSLMFSTILKHPLSSNMVAPVVFIQYLAALAVVEGIQGYGFGSEDGYRRMPVKLKWPNDIYVLDLGRSNADEVGDPSSYVKIGGVLVNSSYSGGDYTLVVGIGLNCSNAAPTTSLNTVLASLSESSQHSTAGPPPYILEKLLSRILFSFDQLYNSFLLTGFAGDIENLYYKHWLHTGQVVALEAEGGVKARIEGITRDWGLLAAEEVTGEPGQERGTGKRWALQSDSNSFDFFKGLIRRKFSL